MYAFSGKRFLMEAKKTHGNSVGVFLRLRQQEEVAKENIAKRRQNRMFQFQRIMEYWSVSGGRVGRR